MTASPGTLPGNLIPLADSEFESALTGNVSAFTNCTLAVDGTRAYTGSQSLKVTATATGDVTVLWGNLAKFQVRASGGLASSYHVWTPNGSRTAKANLWWYQPNGTFISFPVGATHNIAQASWQPIADAWSAPSNAGFGQLAITISGMAAGESAWIDLVFTAQARVQVLCDFAHGAFSASSVAGSAFEDLTPWVRLDQQITLSRGRQDGVSEVQPGTASFSLHNDHGWFTANLSTSPFFPNVKLGRRVQINVADETGAWHTRFDGPIAGIDYSFTPRGTSLAVITLADVMAWLGRGELSAWTKSTVLDDTPALHWTLNDEQGSMVAAETSGNNGPPLRLRVYGSQATFAFAAGNGGVETQANAPLTTMLGTSSSPIQSPYFTTHATDTWGVGQSQSRQLSAAIPALSTRTGSDFTVEAWATFDGTSIYANNPAFMSIFSLGDTSTGKNLTVGWWSAAAGGSGLSATTWANYLALMPGGSGPPPFNPIPLHELDVPMSAPAQGVPVHLVAKVVGNNSGATLTLYVNGTSFGTLALPKFFAPDWLDVGGAFGGNCGWQGNISMVSIYGSALSAGTITAHQVMGSAGNYLLDTDAGITDVVNFTGIPSFWLGTFTDGLAVADWFDITSTSPISAMQTFEQAELAGLLYVNAAGQLTFDGRQMRMGATGPDITLPAGAYTADLGYKVTDQNLITRASIQGPASTMVGSAVNTAAELDTGPYPNGTPSSPTQLMLLSRNPQFDLRGLPGFSGQSEPYLTDAAAWFAFRQSNPIFRAASVTCELLTQNSPADAEYVAPSVVYGVDINKMLHTAGSVSAFPDDNGILDMFIEGVSETISDQAQDITFYTSPAAIGRCWKPGDATYGQLDAAVIGVGAEMTHANAPHSKIHAADPGRPFWPPAYAATMNNGGVSGKGFVGATDQRGVFDTLQLQMAPPVLVVGQSANQQSFGSGNAGAELTLNFDTIYVDSAGGFGLRSGFPNFYVVLVPGMYEIEASVQFAPNASGNRFARLLVHHNGMNQDPSSTAAGALSIGGSSKRTISGVASGTRIATRLYCGVGTTIGVRAWQDSGSTLLTGIAAASGSLLSVTFKGYSTTAD